MRFLLALTAMALFAVSLGCDKPADPAPAPSTPAETEPAAGSDSTEAAPAGSSTSDASPEMDGVQMVSLKLPGMT